MPATALRFRARPPRRRRGQQRPRKGASGSGFPAQGPPASTSGSLLPRSFERSGIPARSSRRSRLCSLSSFLQRDAEHVECWPRAGLLATAQPRRSISSRPRRRARAGGTARPRIGPGVDRGVEDPGSEVGHAHLVGVREGEDEPHLHRGPGPSGPVDLASDVTAGLLESCQAIEHFDSWISPCKCSLFVIPALWMGRYRESNRGPAFPGFPHPLSPRAEMNEKIVRAGMRDGVKFRPYRHSSLTGISSILFFETASMTFADLLIPVLRA